VPFEWTAACQDAFEKLKQALILAPVLTLPVAVWPYVLYTDASNHVICAVLAQIDEHGQERVISYASQTLAAAEHDYSTTHHECLAVVKFVQEFHHYLHGWHFTVVTDHDPLKWITMQWDPTNQLAQWAILLQGFNFNIRYRPGSEHGNADALTRPPFTNEPVVAGITTHSQSRGGLMHYSHKQGLVGWHTTGTTTAPATGPASTADVTSNATDDTSSPETREDNVNDSTHAPAARPDTTEDTGGNSKPTDFTREPAGALGQPEGSTTHDKQGEEEASAKEDRTSPTTMPGVPGINTDLTLVGEERLNKEHIQKAQREDAFLGAIITYLEEGKLPLDKQEAKKIVLEVGQMEINKGLLLRFWWQQRSNRRTATRLQVAIPGTLTEEVLTMVHDNLLARHRSKRWNKSGSTTGGQGCIPRSNSGWLAAQHANNATTQRRTCLDNYSQSHCACDRSSGWASTWLGHCHNQQPATNIYWSSWIT
jgi:hypothetical protein